MTRPWQKTSMLKGKFWRSRRQSFCDRQILEYRARMSLQDAAHPGIDLVELLGAGAVQLLLQFLKLLKLAAWHVWPQGLRRACHA